MNRTRSPPHWTDHHGVPRQRRPTWALLGWPSLLASPTWRINDQSAHPASKSVTAYSTRRIRRDGELVALLEQHEPRSSQALGELLDRGLWSGRCRAWMIEDDDQRPAAAVIAVRPTFDRWYAMVLLLDERAATDVAALVDRSPAWSVNGAAPDIAPLIPLLQRRRFVDVRPWVVTAYPIDVTEVPDDVTRLASGADLDALVELYSTFEFVGGLTAWQLRTMLRHLLDRHYVIVVEWPGDDARFAGAVAITTRTRRLRRARPAHGRAGPPWRGLVLGSRRPRAVDRQRARHRRRCGARGVEPDGPRRPCARRPVRRGRTGAETTVPRPTSPARPLRSLATTAAESPGLVPRTGRHIDARSTGSKLTPDAAERRPEDRRSQAEYLMVQLIEPWPPPPWLLLRNCRAPLPHSLGIRQPVVRTACLGSFRLGIDLSPRAPLIVANTDRGDLRYWPRSVSIGAGIVMLPQDSVVLVAI